MHPYCWQIPSRRLKGKQAEESKGLLTAVFLILIWRMIFCLKWLWPSFWYDGGKKATFLEFRYFFTYNNSKKTKRNYRFEMIYDYRFEIYNLIFTLFSIWYMTVILKWGEQKYDYHFDMTPAPAVCESEWRSRKFLRIKF